MVPRYSNEKSMVPELVEGDNLAKSHPFFQMALCTAFGKRGAEEFRYFHMTGLRTNFFLF